MKTGDRVKTLEGEGLVVHIEFYSRLNGGMNRYGIELDVNRFWYSPVYFFQDEIR